MLVVSPNVVLNPAVADFDADNPIIGWRNIVTINNILSTTEEDANPVINLANPSTGLQWVGLSNTNDEYITVAVPTADDIDYVGLAGHNFGTDRIGVHIYGNSVVDGAYTLIASIMPATDSPIIFRFNPSSYAQIQIKLQPGNNVPRCCVLYIGKLTVCERKIQVSYTPLCYGRMDEVSSHRAEKGQFLGRLVLGSYLESSVNLAFMTPVWYREELDPFVARCSYTPFFFAWAPTSYPEELGYAWTMNNPKPEIHDPIGIVRITFDMQGIA